MSPKRKFHIFSGEEEPGTAALNAVQAIVTSGKRPRVVTTPYITQKSSNTNTPALPMVVPLASSDEAATQAGPAESGDDTVPMDIPSQEPPLKKVDFFALIHR